MVYMVPSAATFRVLVSLLVFFGFFFSATVGGSSTFTAGLSMLATSARTERTLVDTLGTLVDTQVVGAWVVEKRCMMRDSDVFEKEFLKEPA